MALTKGIVEVKKNEGSPEAAGNNGSDEYVQRSFDLSSHEGLEGYWAQLAQMSVDYRLVGKTLVPSDATLACYGSISVTCTIGSAGP